MHALLGRPRLVDESMLSVRYGHTKPYACRIAQNPKHALFCTSCVVEESMLSGQVWAHKTLRLQNFPKAHACITL